MSETMAVWLHVILEAEKCCFSLATFTFFFKTGLIFLLSASGVWASGAPPKPTLYNFKTAHNTATKITRNKALIFPASRHNLIDTMTLFHVTVASYG